VKKIFRFIYVFLIACYQNVVKRLLMKKVKNKNCIPRIIILKKTFSI